MKTTKFNISGQLEFTMSLENASPQLRNRLKGLLRGHELSKSGTMLYKGYKEVSDVYAFIDDLEAFIGQLGDTVRVTNCKVWFDNKAVFEVQGSQQPPLAA